MKKERTIAPVTRCTLNRGQLKWLPKNPRQWTAEAIEKTRRSIVEDPDFLEDRPVLVVPNGGKYVAFAGNLRLTAANKTDMKTIPVVVYTPENDEDYITIKRRAMKDNGSLGAWDFDELADEWDDMPLTDWGIPAWEEKAAEQPAQETHEDDFDEEKDHIEVRCKKGDVWELGEHRLMCGDSIDLEQVKTLMGGGRS